MPGSKQQIENIRHSLQLEERIDLHKKGWLIQRIGWTFLMLVIITGVFGLFGEGVISRRTPSAGAFTIQYDKYFRYQSEMKITLESPTESIRAITFTQPYLKKFRIVRFVPDPQHNMAGTTDVTFTFSGNNRAITAYLIAEESGSINGYVLINKQDSIPLTHFIYP